jgi:hypothetical protein
VLRIEVVSIGMECEEDGWLKECSCKLNQGGNRSTVRRRKPWLVEECKELGGAEKAAVVWTFSKCCSFLVHGHCLPHFATHPHGTVVCLSRFARVWLLGCPYLGPGSHCNVVFVFSPVKRSRNNALKYTSTVFYETIPESLISFRHPA